MVGAAKKLKGAATEKMVAKFPPLFTWVCFIKNKNNLNIKIRDI